MAGDTKLEFKKNYSFNKYLSHTYLGHSDVFSRLMGEVSLDQRK